jgi:hypothetical protein
MTITATARYSRGTSCYSLFSHSNNHCYQAKALEEDSYEPMREHNHHHHPIQEELFERIALEVVQDDPEIVINHKRPSLSSLLNMSNSPSKPFQRVATVTPEQSQVLPCQSSPSSSYSHEECIRLRQENDLLKRNNQTLKSIIDDLNHQMKNLVVVAKNVPANNHHPIHQQQQLQQSPLQQQQHHRPSTNITTTNTVPPAARVNNNRDTDNGNNKGGDVPCSRAQRDKAAKIKFLEGKNTEELVEIYFRTSNLKTIKLIRGVLKRRGKLFLIKNHDNSATN